MLSRSRAVRCARAKEWELSEVGQCMCISMHCQSHRTNKNNLTLHEEPCGALKKEREEQR